MCDFRADYKQHPFEKPQGPQRETYKKPEGDLDFRTNYAQQFTRTHLPA